MTPIGWLQRWRAMRAEPAVDAGVFDAVIRVRPETLPPGVALPGAMLAIRRAVEAVPGAEMISVQQQPDEARGQAVSVFPASGSVVFREALSVRLERVVAATMRGLAPGVAPALATGFSDGQDFAFMAPFQEPAEAVAAVFEGTDLSALSDTDLLARLLGYVGPDSGAAARAIAQFGSFANVLSAPNLRLGAVPGVGVHSLAAIKLIHAAALRLALAAVMDQPVLDGSAALLDYLTAVLARESVEHFRILFLDAEGRLRADEAQARGTVNHTPVYPREVVRRALELRAASVILVHNHPSGDPSASADDIEMTTRIEQAAEAVGISVRDHIIVGNGRWFSFWQEGLLRRRP